jgi:hypothetical protein
VQETATGPDLSDGGRRGDPHIAAPPAIALSALSKASERAVRTPSVVTGAQQFRKWVRFQNDAIGKWRSLIFRSLSLNSF